MSQDVSLKMTELDRLTSLPHMQLVKAALPYIHIPEQRFFSLFVKFRELEKTMQLFADPADGEIGICSVGERDKDSPVDMLKAIKPYGTSLPSAVTIRMGISFFSRTARQMVKPSVPGSIRSRSRRSQFSVRAAFSPDVPSEQMVTS